MRGAKKPDKEDIIMAEDLRIRVKVDPNLDGLQEQLDGKAKNLHHGMMIFRTTDILLS